MTIQELYEQTGGDYQGIKGRLMNDDLIKRFLLKFLDEKSYSEMLVAAKANDVQETISTSHKMKGVVANLSFTKLFDLLTELLAQLRQEGQTEVNMELIEEITVEYEKVVALIREL